MAEQTEGPCGIEAEVTELGSGGVNVPALERWAVWHIRREPDYAACRWAYDGAWDSQPAAESIAAIREEDGFKVRIVHFCLPALTIQAKET